MLSLAKGAREAFNGMFPPVSPEKRHLLRNLVPAEPRKPVEEDPNAALSLTALTKKLMTDKKMSFVDAQNEAAAILNKRAA